MYLFYSLFVIKLIYFLQKSVTLFEKMYFLSLLVYLLLFPYFSYINYNNQMIIKLNKSMIFLPLFIFLPYENIQLCNFLFYLLLLIIRYYYQKCPLRILTNSEPKGSLSFNDKNLIMFGFMVVSLLHYFRIKKIKNTKTNDNTTEKDKIDQLNKEIIIREDVNRE